MYQPLKMFTLSLLNRSNKKSFIANDGSVFDSQTDLDVYQKLYDTTKPLFSNDEQTDSAKQILGF